MFKLVTLLVLVAVFSSASAAYTFNLYLASATSNPAILVSIILKPKYINVNIF